MPYFTPVQLQPKGVGVKEDTNPTKVTMNPSHAPAEEQQKGVSAGEDIKRDRRETDSNSPTKTKITTTMNNIPSTPPQEQEKDVGWRGDINRNYREREDHEKPIIPKSYKQKDPWQEDNNRNGKQGHSESTTVCLCCSIL